MASGLGAGLAGICIGVAGVLVYMKLKNRSQVNSAAPIKETRADDYMNLSPVNASHYSVIDVGAPSLNNAVNTGDYETVFNNP